MSGALTPTGRNDLNELVAASRELGADPALVLHGGGNTSVKTTWLDVTGREEQVLLVKGSGHDLASIDSDGFAPLRLERLRDLLPPTVLADGDVADEFRSAMAAQNYPDASVESLVHALLPQKFVLHSHADVLLAVMNTPAGREHVKELAGGDIVIVDYAMPGPELAAECLRALDASGLDPSDVAGLAVMNHGLFTVGETGKEALKRHQQVIAAAERVVGAARPESSEDGEGKPLTLAQATQLAELRQRLSHAAGAPLILRRHCGSTVQSFLSDDASLAAASAGPLTPDHVIWTRRVPLIGRDIGAYVAASHAYFEEHANRRNEPLIEADPAPRVIVDEELGMLSAGRNSRESSITEDIYLHTMETIPNSVALGGYEPASAGHVFDLEYWAPQQEKLQRADGHKPLAGTVVLVTGAASGIGRACASEFLTQGASVIGWDISDNVTDMFSSPEWLGLQVDVTDRDAQARALAAGVEAFGGLDVLVIAAGIFPKAQHLDELEPEMWSRTMRVNVDSVATLYGLAYPLLKHAPTYGRVSVIASKNFLAPGPGASAYSASKAALTQLSRVAALEWAGDGIRVNMVHPDAVFDTALWTPELLAQRAEHYGMSVDEYKRRNLLRAEVTSADVARLARAMADDTFRCTTGAQVPIDGGNERVV